MTVLLVVSVMTASLAIGRLSRRWCRPASPGPESEGQRSSDSGDAGLLRRDRKMSSVKRLASRLVTWLRERKDVQLELCERRVLLNRPWEEDFVHWAYDGSGWHLHGHLLPPHAKSRRSTTSRGWCPALRATELSTDVPPAP